MCGNLKHPTQKLHVSLQAADALVFALMRAGFARALNGSRNACVEEVHFHRRAVRHPTCSSQRMFLLTTSLVAGLIAGLMSLPHCAFMCGPLAGAACSGQEGALVSKSGAAYVLTRALAYTALGALAGATGGLVDAFFPPAWARSLLAMSLAVGMVILAVRLFRASAPRSTSPKLVPLQTKASATALGKEQRATLTKPMLLGALTALLPCGSLYAALLVAGATASALTGAVSMFGFALGSAPALVLWQSFARWSERMNRETQVGLGVVFLAFAGLMIVRGWPREDPNACCHVTASSVDR